MLRELPLYIVNINLPSQVSYAPSMLFPRNNAVFKGENKQQSVIHCALIVYNTHLEGRPFLNKTLSVTRWDFYGQS